jgi:hypothetical protein
MVYALRDTVGQIYPVGQSLRIGRDPANQIVLQDQKASRFHCTLIENQGILMLQDENSSNGTFVNHIPFQGQIQLKVGDTISIGDSNFIVEQATEQIVNPPPPVNLPQTPLPSQPPYVYQPPVVNQSPVVNPPAAVPAVNQPVAKKSGISPVFPLIFILLVSLICVGSAISGYVYYKAPQSEKNKVLNYFGKGPASIQVNNLNDTTVYMFATTSLDTSAADENAVGINTEVSSFGIVDQYELDSGAYRFDFGSQAGGMDLGTCIFNIKGGEVYNFVVIPDHIIVDRTEYPESSDRDPTSVTEFEVATSSLCHYKSK